VSASIHYPSPHRRLAAQRPLSLVARGARLATRWLLVLASLVGVLALGLYTQVHQGTWQVWIARDLSAAVYALAWCMGLASLRPRSHPLAVAAVALAVCFAIELSQLWHPHWLEVPRATAAGRLVLGSVFTWSDLAYYAGGAAMGALWLRLLPFRAKRRARVRDDFVRPMGVRPL